MISKMSHLINIENSKFLLLADPRYESSLYGVRVTKIRRKDELHFILRSNEGNDPVVFKGHESATCLQVLFAFGEELEGKCLNDIHFYSFYERSWRHLSFNKFEVDLVKKRWPECDSGEALGDVVVTSLGGLDLNKRLKSDSNANAFLYWYHCLESADLLYEQYINELCDAKKYICKKLPFGELEYDVTEHREVHFLFAVNKRVLKSKIHELQSNNSVVFMTPIEKGWIQGWVCGVVVVGRTNNNWEFIEPGEHCVHPCYFIEYPEKMIAAGGCCKTLADGRIVVDLPVEVDFTKPNGGPLVMARRGLYIFSKGVDDESSF